MQISDFHFFDKDLHCVHFIDDGGRAAGWHVGEEVRLVRDRDDLVLAQTDAIALVKANHEKTVDLAAARLSLWRLAKRGADHAHLEHVCVQRLLSMDLKVGVDAYVAEQLHKEQLISENSIAQATKWLSQEFILERSEPWLIARYFKSQTRSDFQLLGRDHALSIQEHDGVWKAKTLSKLKRDNREIIAISGMAEFVDDSISSRLSGGAVDLLAQQIHESGSYLSLWQSYSELQWKIATRTAKKLGMVHYSAIRHTGREVPVFQFDVGQEQAVEFGKRVRELQNSDELGAGDIILEIAETEPSWLIDQSVSATNDQKGTRPLLGRDLKVRPPYIEVEVRQKRPPKKGCIFLSVQGDKSAHERREQAYSSIQSYSNPMPQLRLLLEGVESPDERRIKLKALSRKAKQRFKGEPTRRQQEALQVALNTPDVALVIGPPGTGKTQVITALQQRIADEFPTSSAIQHQVLLTSFQHDAVDNVVERSGVFGLPAIKIGGRRFGGDGAEDPITKWRITKVLELKPQLDKELKSWPIFERYQALKNKILELRISRDLGLRRTLALDVDDLLNQLASQDDLHLSESLRDSWYAFLGSLNTSGTVSLSSEVRQRLLRSIRGIRSNQIAFADDGMERLKGFQSCVEAIGALAGNEHIQRLIEIHDGILNGLPQSDELVAEIGSLKGKLLDVIRPDYRPALLRSYMDDADCQLLDDLESEVYELICLSRTLGPLMARCEYIEALETKATSVEESIQDYVSVLGATCQQAAGDRMIGLKGVSERQGISFDTVIVDEAARANPLDLMIPMAMARRRIVLVGDHLQLPHMLEAKVESELQEQQELDAVEAELLRISLFEHLHRLFLGMEKNGGPKRVVMLDTQFRMHPELGSFVSREFYERRGFDAIESGLGEEYFEHDIAGYQGSIAAWIDVPKTEGLERKRDGSRVRESEAKRCALEASKILENHPETSVGIITFYSAQREAIYEELGVLGYAELTEEGWQIGSNYRLTPSGEERLRVGSVDAFQGKEFDVVLLSVVRTWNPVMEITKDILNRQLGFLRLPNRINVAMSRQKKLLIVIGDQELAQVNGTDPSDESPYLPGFPAFLKMCEGPYGKVL